MDCRQLLKRKVNRRMLSIRFVNNVETRKVITKKKRYAKWKNKKWMFEEINGWRKKNGADSKAKRRDIRPNNRRNQTQRNMQIDGKIKGSYEFWC